MNVANYRPISILPSVSKLFEKEMTIQMSNYFEGIFSQYLSGFRKSHSCETVLIRMVENIKKALDAGKIVCAVLMDLSKAFDCLPHKLLPSKFKAYGMSPLACRLLSSYLKDRQQRAIIGDKKGKWQHVSKGAAQGSITGPFCFNVFTNDLLNTFDDKVEIYN